MTNSQTAVQNSWLERSSRRAPGYSWSNPQIISNKKLTKDLHKSINRKLEKIQVHSPSIDNIWGADK